MKLHVHTHIGLRQGDKFRLLVPLLLLLLLLLSLALALLPVQSRLVVSMYKTGEMLFTLPFLEGEQFRIAYLHSVNRSEVVDTIEREGDALVVRYAFFKTFGAGIPIPEDRTGTELIQTPEGFWLTGIDLYQDEFVLMLEEIPNHSLEYRGSEIALLSRFGAGAALHFQMRSVSLFEALRYDNRWT